MFDNRIVTSIHGCRETARPPVVSVGEPEKAGQGALNGPVSPSESRRIPAVFPTFSPWPGGVFRDPPRAPNRFLPPRAAASADGHRDDGGVPGIARHLTACGKSHAAFERRCIPPEPRLCEALCVALPSKYTRYSSLARLVRRAPRHSRRSRDFLHRLLSGDASGARTDSGNRTRVPGPVRKAGPAVAPGSGSVPGRVPERWRCAGSRRSPSSGRAGILFRCP